jgi:agmatine deiminase
MIPRDAGFRMPAEWDPHLSTWLAWPSDANLWREDLGPARESFGALVSAIALDEPVEVLVPDASQEALAREALPSTRVRFHRVPFGDIWLRDIAPIFLVDDRGATATLVCRFNGWGGKFVLEHDDRVAERVADIVGGKRFDCPFVLEGGSVEVDGDGTVLATRQCLLNANRNNQSTVEEVEGWLLGALGAVTALWLDRGLVNDHTDGHVDTLARFASPGALVVMEPRSEKDPNRDVLRQIVRDARRMVDARGRRLELACIPSPGRVVDGDGTVMPASYVNYYVSNASVIVPTYDTPWDAEAVERIGALFPGRKSIGVDARPILTGGGAFHCITQQQPRGTR